MEKNLTSPPSHSPLNPYSALPHTKEKQKIHKHTHTKGKDKQKPKQKQQQNPQPRPSKLGNDRKSLRRHTSKFQQKQSFNSRARFLHTDPDSWQDRCYSNTVKQSQ